MANKIVHKPKVRVRLTRRLSEFYNKLTKVGISTICVSGRCPNRCICFSQRRVSVLILGGVCTRNCSFCGVPKGICGAEFEWEIDAICELVKELSLRFIVITSVTRDDLVDGGAGHFCRIVEAIRNVSDSIKIELLIPDFGYRWEYVDEVAGCDVEIIGHNIETVERLFSKVRCGFSYRKSLELIGRLTRYRSIVKSSIIVGLGESIDEVVRTLKDLRDVGCNAICIGQYLCPDEDKNFRVKKLYSDEEFKFMEDVAKNIGFRYVWSGRFVRSSFVGEELYGLGEGMC